uniref:Uncharacterized protein n=1 Tax=Steinernema glaseri TaxID=37863 RepID=A0A1I7YW75_9BILA
MEVQSGQLVVSHFQLFKESGYVTATSEAEDDSHVGFLKSLFVRLGRPMGQLRRDSQAPSQVRFSSVLSHPTLRLVPSDSSASLTAAKLYKT